MQAKTMTLRPMLNGELSLEGSSDVIFSKTCNLLYKLNQCLLDCAVCKIGQAEMRAENLQKRLEEAKFIASEGNLIKTTGKEKDSLDQFQSARALVAAE